MIIWYLEKAQMAGEGNAGGVDLRMNEQVRMLKTLPQNIAGVGLTIKLLIGKVSHTITGFRQRSIS